MRKKTRTKPATRKPAKVKKIIASPHPEIPEKAEISIEDCDDLYREIRIDNSLTDGTGDEVKLKQGRRNTRLTTQRIRRIQPQRSLSSRLARVNATFWEWDYGPMDSSPGPNCA